ncbi:MAG TPA: DUF5989 family protein [Kiloniellales bacterium]|nr:DUF5989 family protein [Kiloniellales bacterium]
MSFIAEFYRFLRARKKYWMVPTIVLLVLLGGLLIAVKGSAIAPFLYTLF